MTKMGKKKCQYGTLSLFPSFLPFPFPLVTLSLPSLCIHFRSRRFPLQIQLGGLGERCELPCGSRQSQANKGSLVHFELIITILG